MEGETKDSAGQSLKDREIKIRSRKFWRKVEKVFKTRNWLMQNVNVIGILLLENLPNHQKNKASELATMPEKIFGTK